MSTPARCPLLRLWTEEYLEYMLDNAKPKQLEQLRQHVKQNILLVGCGATAPAAAVAGL
jgi:hypothetical protein